MASATYCSHPAKGPHGPRPLPNRMMARIRCGRRRTAEPGLCPLHDLRNAMSYGWVDEFAERLVQLVSGTSSSGASIAMGL